MKNRCPVLIGALLAALVLSSGAYSQTKPATNSAIPANTPKRDLTGVWAVGPSGLSEPAEDAIDLHESPGGAIPPMTPWAKELYDAEKPGYGKRAAPGGNDPILQCDPMGFPRIMYFITPFEFFQIPGRVLQAFERDHIVRVIWTDGRTLPKGAADNPLWYGYSVGKWEDDYTFVVETVGLDDRTWLGAAGYPHSTSMRVVERYHRVDPETIQYDVTMTDPEAYTKPWVAATKTIKLKPKTEIPQGFCVYSEENAFTQRIRVPAAAPTTHK